MCFILIHTAYDSSWHVITGQARWSSALVSSLLVRVPPESPVEFALFKHRAYSAEPITHVQSVKGKDHGSQAQFIVRCISVKILSKTKPEQKHIMLDKPPRTSYKDVLETKTCIE